VNGPYVHPSPVVGSAYLDRPIRLTAAQLRTLADGDPDVPPNIDCLFYGGIEHEDGTWSVVIGNAEADPNEPGNGVYLEPDGSYNYG